MRYLLPKFVDFVDGVTDRQTHATKQYTRRYHAPTNKKCWMTVSPTRRQSKHCIVRPHRSTTYVDAAYYTDRVVWSVGLSVCRSVTVVSPAKTAEPIEMPFGLYGLG